jgi:hypothetical protein
MRVSDCAGTAHKGGEEHGRKGLGGGQADANEDLMWNRRKMVQQEGLDRLVEWLKWTSFRQSRFPFNPSLDTEHTQFYPMSAVSLL